VIFALVNCFPWVTLPGVIPPTVAPEAVEVPPIEVKAGPAQVPILIYACLE